MATLSRYAQIKYLTSVTTLENNVSDGSFRKKGLLSI